MTPLAQITKALFREANLTHASVDTAATSDSSISSHVQCATRASVCQ